MGSGDDRTRLISLFMLIIVKEESDWTSGVMFLSIASLRRGHCDALHVCQTWDTSEVDLPRSCSSICLGI